MTTREHELEDEAAYYSEDDTCLNEYPEGGWHCFHCGEHLTTVGAARDHFGASPSATPGCFIKVEVGDERGWLMEIRKLEDAVGNLQVKWLGATAKILKLEKDNAIKS